MITINKIGGFNNLKQAEIYCLAKDKDLIDKEGIPNGSTLYIIDYKQSSVSPLWMFDAENKEWVEQ